MGTITVMTQRVGLWARLTLGIHVTAATKAKWWPDYDVTARA